MEKAKKKGSRAKRIFLGIVGIIVLLMHDIGILASTDPVALDQACVDLVYAAEDGASLIERIESRNGLLTLKHAEEIGLGTRWYQLTNID